MTSAAKAEAAARRIVAILGEMATLPIATLPQNEPVDEIARQGTSEIFTWFRGPRTVQRWRAERSSQGQLSRYVRLTYNQMSVITLRSDGVDLSTDDRSTRHDLVSMRFPSGGAAAGDVDLLVDHLGRHLDDEAPDGASRKKAERTADILDAAAQSAMRAMITSLLDDAKRVPAREALLRAVHARDLVAAMIDVTYPGAIDSYRIDAEASSISAGVNSVGDMSWHMVLDSGPLPIPDHVRAMISPNRIMTASASVDITPSFSMDMDIPGVCTKRSTTVRFAQDIPPMKDRTTDPTTLAQRVREHGGDGSEYGPAISQATASNVRMRKKP